MNFPLFCGWLHTVELFELTVHHLNVCVCVCAWLCRCESAWKSPWIAGTGFIVYGRNHLVFQHLVTVWSFQCCYRSGVLVTLPTTIILHIYQPLLLQLTHSQKWIFFQHSLHRVGPPCNSSSGIVQSTSMTKFQETNPLVENWRISL